MRRVPKLRFYLYASRRRSCVITAAVYHKGQYHRISTGINVEPRNWNSRKQRMKISAAGAGTVNAALDKMEAQYRERMLEVVTRCIDVPSDAVRAALLYAIKGAYGGGIADDILRYMDARRVDYTEGTLRTYDALRQFIERYQQHKRCVVTYELLNASMLREMLDYMLTVEQYQNAQIQKLVKRLRTFLRYAKLHGWGNAPILEVPLKIPSPVRIERAYLRMDELERYRTAALPSKLAQARDMFVLQCYTGLRWSDVQRINRAMYDDTRNELVLVTQKTRKVVRIPLLQAAREILERYQWQLPQHSNAYQNALIKEGLKIVGIVEPVTIVEYRGAQRIERVVPKCDAISTHAAKRTFVSILLAHGVTLETVCRITGNTRATIEAYIQKDQTEVRTEMQRVLERDAASLLVSPFQKDL